MSLRHLHSSCLAALALILCLQSRVATADSVSVGSYKKITVSQGGMPSGTISHLDLFGGGIANMGDNNLDGVPDLLIGAPGDDRTYESGGNFDYGGARLLHMNANGTANEVRDLNDASPFFDGPLSYGDEFGKSIAAGNVDGDILNDVIVGAPGDNTGGSNRGAVYVIPYWASGYPKTFYTKIASGTGGFTATLDDFDAFGSSVAYLGDWDGDGNAEIAVGAPGDDDGGMDRGAFYILFLNANGTVKSHQKISCSTSYLAAQALQMDHSSLEDGDELGGGIACIGDVDGDGDMDLAVGAPQDKDPQLNEPRGSMWIFFMNADGSVEAHQKIGWWTQSNFAYHWPRYGEFGSALAPAGDLNSDGTPDLLVGAPGEFNGAGSAYVCLLWPNGRIKHSQRICTADGGFAGTASTTARFGSAVAMVPDYNGDGKQELAIGSEYETDSGITPGAVFMFDLNVTVTPPDVQAPSFFGPTHVLNTTAEFETAEEPWTFGPSIATDKQGNWVAVWESNMDDPADFDVVFSRSSDNGNTWTPPANLQSNHATDGTTNDTMPEVFYLGNGQWICHWFGFKYARSTDNGATWSPVALAVTSSISSNYDRIAHDGNGTIMMVYTDFIRANSFDDDLFTVYSTNYGQTWSAPRLALNNSGQEHWTQIQTDRRGNWVVLWQNYTNGAFTTMKSSDLGLTWTAPVAVSTSLNDGFFCMEADNSGTLLMAFPAPISNGLYIDRLLCRRSTDGGATWSAPIVMHEGTEKNPSLAVDDDGTWVAVMNRHDGTDQDVYVSRSFDGGLTWSTPIVVNDHNVMDEGHDFYGDIETDGNGRWLMAWKSQEQWVENKWVDRDGDVLFAVSDAANVFYSNGTGGGTFSSGAAWSGALVPGSAHKAIILSGDTVTLTGSATLQNLEIQPGGMLVEGNGTVLTVAGEVVNSGTLRCIRSVAAPGPVDFSLTRASVVVDTQGSLSSIQVDRVDSNSPVASMPALETGIYWSITPTGAGFITSLTLPYDSTRVSDPMLARYDGSRWVSARSSMTPTNVTLSGVQQFSPWTVSSGTVPVTISGFSID